MMMMIIIIIIIINIIMIMIMLLLTPQFCTNLELINKYDIYDVTSYDKLPPHN